MGMRTDTSFDIFLDRIGEASGQRGLVEAVRRGYRVLTEGTEGTEEFPEIPGWTLDDGPHRDSSYEEYNEYTSGPYHVTVRHVLTTGKYSIHRVWADVKIPGLYPDETELYGGPTRYNLPDTVAERIRDDYDRSELPGVLGVLHGYLSGLGTLGIIRAAFIEAISYKTHNDYATIGSMYGSLLLCDDPYDEDDDFFGMSLHTLELSSDTTVRVFERLFGEKAGYRPVADLLTVSPEKIFLVGAKESGYDFEYMQEVLGIGLIIHSDVDTGDVFDQMAREVELDPLSYVDNDQCMFRDYARQLVNGEEV